jgi:ABC-type lipoprotein release transport system permease subunit
MTIIGGVVGLLAAWLIIALFSRQLNSLVPGSFMDNISQMGEIPDSGFFDFRDFFKFWLYLALLGIILVLNLVSALIPAAKVIRRPITESLNYKK